MSQSFAFVKFGSFSHTNELVLEQLRQQFGDPEADVIDVLDFRVIRPRSAPRLLREIAAEHNWRAFYTKERFHRHAIRTPYFFQKTRELLLQRLSGRRYAFTFQTQALFDASLLGVPHFLYTDHTHKANLYYPGFDAANLCSDSWIECERSAYRNARVNFTMSTNVARSLVEQYGCAPERVRCVYAGSNLALIQEDDGEARFHAKHILFVGFDWERKGGPQLLEAFQRVRQTHPTAQLTVVGCSPDINVPGCRVVGRVPLADVARYYAGASIFCMPSRIEPFGIVYLEAFAHGLPVVASDLGATPDFITEGLNGFLVQPDDVGRLAERLDWLLERPAQCAEFGRRGRDLVRDRYTWPATGARLAAHIRLETGLAQTVTAAVAPAPRREHTCGRTIVLGLDSIDIDLVQRWVAEGDLPFFAELLRTVPLVRLSLVSRVLQGALWPSLISGRTPGHHGMFYNPALTNGTYNLDQVEADAMQCETFYERMGNHGIAYAVADIPTDRPLNQANGMQVIDWGTEFKYWRYATHPPELLEQIEARIGRHFLADGRVTGITEPEHRELLRLLEQGVKMKSALAAELIARKDRELVFVVFGEPHKAGHFLWKYMDPTHPDNRSKDPVLRDGLRSVYRLIDAELARLAASLAPADNLLVLSDMGMQANYRGDHFIDALMARMGLCKSQTQTRLDQAESQLPPGARAAVVARGVLGRVVRRLAPHGLQRRLRAKFGAAAAIDWSHTRAFALPTDRNTYLRINVRGREPQGVVEPGAEYDALVQRIEREFRALVNVETGKPAIEEVFRIREVFPGERADNLPDVSILWSGDAPLNIIESRTLGRLTRRVEEERSGNHRAEGFLLARGPAFRTGRAELQGDILQIAPTLLALHGVPIPEWYEKPALTDVLVTEDAPV